MPACESEDTAHDGQKHLRDSISLHVPRIPWQKLGAYIELGVLLRSGTARVRGNVAGPAAGRSGSAKAGGSAEG